MKTLIEIKRFLDVINIFLLTTAGSATIVIVCLCFQLPGVTIYASNILLKRSELFDLKGSLFVGFLFAAILDFVIYYFAIKKMKLFATGYALVSGILSFSSYRDFFLLESPALSFIYIAGIMPIFIISVFPATTIAIVSEKMANEVNTDSTQSIVSSINEASKESLLASYKKAVQQISNKEEEKPLKFEQRGNKKAEEFLKSLQN